MTAPDDVRARPMDTAPRDGTLLRLQVRFTEHATEDAEEAWTIGSNSFDANGEDVWQFAGWCWEHDHFTEGKGTPIGWLPMHDSHADLSGEVRELVEAAGSSRDYLEAYFKACQSSQPTDWHEAALLAKQWHCRIDAALAKFHPTHQEKP